MVLRTITAALSVCVLLAACGGASESADDSEDAAQTELAQAPSCGGIAGLACPSGFKCVDYPNDSCDPAQGDADCSGTCVKKHKTKIHCGGFAGTVCPAGLVCIDNPSDGCDPAHGGADCGGTCVAK